MRILWVKANKLLPAHSGGDIRSFHIARHLRKWHDLSFLSYYDGEPDPAYERELNNCFPGAVCMCTGKSLSRFARGLDYVLRLRKQAAYAVSRFESPKLQQKLKSWFQDNACDVAVCDFLDAAINFPENLNVPTVLFEHNVESEIWRRHAATEKNPANRLVYALEFRKMLRYEREMVRKFLHVIAVSEHDRQMMSHWVDASRISVVPTGVDVQQFRNEPTSEPYPMVMFVGAMDWEPNIDAVEYFSAEIWPAVLRRVPEARFRIVGRNPDGRVQRLASDSVEITGRVNSVVDQFREAAVVIVPLRIGGGTRLKIYEAMAAGKAVVSTAVGAEGLDVHHGSDIVLADKPEIFAEAITTFLLDVPLRRRFEQAAAELASRYDWAPVARRFSEVLEQTVEVARNRVSSKTQHGKVQATVGRNRVAIQ